MNSLKDIPTETSKLITNGFSSYILDLQRFWPLMVPDNEHFFQIHMEKEYRQIRIICKESLRQLYQDFFSFIVNATNTL